MDKKLGPVVCALLCFLSALPLVGYAAEDVISADELRQWQLRAADFTLFDARSRTDYDLNHIEGAVLPLPLSHYQALERFRAGVSPAPPDLDAALGKAMEAVPKDRSIVTYCSVDCGASRALRDQLKAMGFLDVRSMEEGIQTWEAKGFPVVKSEGPSSPHPAIHKN